MPINARLERTERVSRSAFVSFERPDCSCTQRGAASRARPVTAFEVSSAAAQQAAFGRSRTVRPAPYRPGQGAVHIYWGGDPG